MSYQMSFINGPEQGRQVKLRPGQTIVIGRGEDCGLVIEDAHASRVHCRLEVDDDKVLLVDEDSSYGTMVNGEKIDQQVLQPGDVIRLGETEIQLSELNASTQSTLLPGTATPAVTPGQVPTDTRLLKLVGQTLQRYKIGEPVAQGSSGMIFRAVDTTKDIPIAVKVLWPELSGQKEEIERFVRAIKTMMPIKHPNIIRLHGAGFSGGYCWMAMEFIEGESVASVIERIGVGGMLEWESALRIALHIARALDVAYEHKIIHRNITPQNILIRSSDKTAKLGDLMLAKALEGNLSATITKPGELVGDLAYMSPEQTTGADDVDCRSDIYNLGATTYRLVTGRLPVEGENVADTIRKIRNLEPPKPTTFQLSIPSLLEDVILRMLKKNPDERHQTPAELIKELERTAKYQGVTDL